ncbi:MAG: ZIP family metal transporter [Flavobacteriales bacterium]
MLNSIILLLVVYLGVAIVYFFGNKIGKGYKLLLTFSGAFLMGMIFLHLAPEVFIGGDVSMGWWVIVGFLLQLFLEHLSQGAEHGHVHNHSGQSSFPLMIFISLCLHALIEAMPLGSHADHHHHNLMMGLAVHKLPVAIVLATMLMNSGKSKWSVFIYLSIFALMAPVGIGLFHLIESTFMNEATWLFQAVNALLIGILLHISTTILFESEEGHRISWVKLITVLVGIGLSAFQIH